MDNIIFQIVHLIVNNFFHISEEMPSISLVGQGIPRRPARPQIPLFGRQKCADEQAATGASGEEKGLDYIKYILLSILAECNVHIRPKVISAIIQPVVV